MAFLLHKAARAGLTIYFDDVAECAKMWPTKGVDPALLKELDAHSNENRAFSSRRSIFRLLLPAVSDDSALKGLYYSLSYDTRETPILWAYLR